MIIDGLLIGFILCAALTSGLFFLKFWRATRDPLFLAFAIVLACEGFTRLAGLFLTATNDQIPIIYIIRLGGYLLLLATIVARNRKSSAKKD